MTATRITTLLIGSLAALAATAACSVETGDGEVAGIAEQEVYGCADAKMSLSAHVAMQSALAYGRLNPMLDLTVKRSPRGWKYLWIGRDCGSSEACNNLKGLLALQLPNGEWADEHSGCNDLPGIDVCAWRGDMWTHWEEMAMHNQWYERKCSWGETQYCDNVLREHTLSYVGVTGDVPTCGGGSRMFEFIFSSNNGSSPESIRDVALLTFGGGDAANPYLNYTISGNRIKFDPERIEYIPTSPTGVRQYPSTTYFDVYGTRKPVRGERCCVSVNCSTAVGTTMSLSATYFFCKR
jgi:hypothetical protein